MTFPSIQIRLIKDASCAELDDSIQIRPINGHFLWDYKHHKFVGHHVMHLNSVSEVMQTFDAMTNALFWDVDPFVSMQLDTPAFPAVLFTMNNVNMALSDIRRLMLQALEKLPQVMSENEIIDEVDSYRINTIPEEDEDMEECADSTPLCECNAECDAPVCTPEDEDEDEDEDYEDSESFDMPPLVPIPRPAYLTRLQERLMNSSQFVTPNRPTRPHHTNAPERPTTEQNTINSTGAPSHSYFD